MNIFQNRESFMGSLDSKLAKDALLSLFQLAKQIGVRLDKQAYLLDCYLSIFFEGVKGTLAYDAADEGFTRNNEWYSTFFDLFNKIDKEKYYPPYNETQKRFAKQATQLPFHEEYTKLCLLMLQLADETMIYSTDCFVNEQVDNLSGELDEFRLPELYNQISHVVGESMMEELNEKLKQRFLSVPMAAVFAQGMTNDLLYRLSACDCETGKQMFRLFMDSLPDLQ